MRLLLFLVFLLSSQTIWAGQAKVEAIAWDPYVSILVIDADTGKNVFSENPDTGVYPISVLKLMGLLVILDDIQQGRNSLEEMAQVTVEVAKTGLSLFDRFGRF